MDLPDTNLPNAGEVFAIVIRKDAGGGWTKAITDFIGSGSCGYSSLTYAEAFVFTGDLTVDKDSEVGGVISTWNTLLITADLPNVGITSAALVYCAASQTTIDHKLIIESGGNLGFGTGAIVTLPGGLQLNGFILGDEMAAATLVAFVTVAGDSEIYWSDVAITGGLNANGFTVTHTNTEGATLTLDVAGVFALGGVAVGLAVEIDATGLEVTAGASIECGSFTMTAGTFTGGAYNVTTHGSIVHTAGTITGTGTYTMAATGNLNLDCATAHLRVSAGTTTMTGLVAVSSVFIAAGATLDGDSQNMTLAAGRITGYGTLTNLVPAGIIHVAYGVIDGGNNSANVIFDPQQKMVIV